MEPTAKQPVCRSARPEGSTVSTAQGSKPCRRLFLLTTRHAESTVGKARRAETSEFQIPANVFAVSDFLVFFFRVFLMRSSLGSKTEGHGNVSKVLLSTQYALVPSANVSNQEMLPQLFAPRAGAVGRINAGHVGKTGERSLLASFRFTLQRRPR